MKFFDNPTQEELEAWINELDPLYSNIKRINDHQYAVVNPFIFTHAILLGTIGDNASYDDRWCYDTKEQAIKALDEWEESIAKEPSGWKRHPDSGRRRINGDPATEYVEL